MASLLVLATTRQQLHPQSAAYSERRALWPDSLCQGVWQQTLEKSAYLRRLNIKTILFPSHCQVQLLRAFSMHKTQTFPTSSRCVYLRQSCWGRFPSGHSEWTLHLPRVNISAGSQHLASSWNSLSPFPSRVDCESDITLPLYGDNSFS